MLQLLDIVGFRSSSTTYCIIEKYFNRDSKKNEFLMVFTNDFHGDTQFYLNNDISHISRFFNTLKNNGSMIFYPPRGFPIVLGKKFRLIKNDTPLFELFQYESDPFTEPELDQMLIESTDLSLADIFRQVFGHDDTSFLD